VVGGNPAYGTITQGGLYSAPSVIPLANAVKVRATSVPKPAVYGESVVTISQPTPWVWSMYPGSLTTGMGRSIKLNGSAFIPEAVVRVGGKPWKTTYVNQTTLTAAGDQPAAGTFTVTVAHPDPGGVVSQPVNLTVTIAPVEPVSVTIRPTAAPGSRRLRPTSSAPLWRDGSERPRRAWLRCSRIFRSSRPRTSGLWASSGHAGRQDCDSSGTVASV